MLLKLRKIYKSKEIAWIYKKLNPEYKPGKIILIRNGGISKCVRCKWNTLAGLECGLYRMRIHTNNLFGEINIQNLCLTKVNKEYTILSIKTC